MRVHFIVTSRQRALGAMFSKNLNDEMLVFFYPESAPRTFHTFFCPPIKMIALDADGQVVFEEIVTKWRFVHLPACKFVIETAPKVNTQPYMDTILSYNPPFPQYGAVEPGVDLHALLFALLSDAVADIRRVREAHGYDVRPEIQRDKFAPWERGQMVSSAGFLLDFSERCKPAARRCAPVSGGAESRSAAHGRTAGGFRGRHPLAARISECLHALRQAGFLARGAIPSQRRSAGRRLALPAPGKCRAALPPLHRDSGFPAR